ncbi:MAG: peptidoglycan DD-metalloendopeptidase family protein [Lachnospiraceae bacterium]|nr:peptidoglycan DD-metalloendopeptidase family protein [Lachnospiraceae bacterium]
MNRKRKNGLKKDRIVMLLASVFMLTALTMAGVYVNQKNVKEEDDGYSIDLNELNRDVQEQVDEIGSQMPGGANEESPSLQDDLDVEISYEDVGTSDVVLPAEDEAALEDVALEEDAQQSLREERTARLEDITGENITEVNENQNVSEAGDVAEGVTEVTSASEESVLLDFDENATLSWPLAGNIILDYSMDSAIFFETLQQYRYNPSLVIEAVVGEPITAAADGQVSAIYSNVETGGTICCDLGNGYELIYGQLENFTVAEGDYVHEGDILGFVAEPSIFYTQEGSNVYFEMKKDGEPINPSDYME